MIKNCLLATALSFALAGNALAAINAPTFQRTLPVYKAFDPDQLYSVTITCAPRGGDIEPISERTGFLGATKTKYTTTHAVFISTNTAQQFPDGTAKLPKGGLGMALVYLTDGDKNSEVDNREGCDQSFLVKQSNTLFVIPTLSFNRTVKPGPLFAAITPLVKLITPLASVFFGTAIPDLILNKVSAVSQAEDPFGKLLALFNKNINYARSYKLSTAGPTIIDTQFSRVTITVKLIPAIVDEPKYIGALRTQIDGAPDKFTTTNIRTSCVDMAKVLGRAGFVSPRDQAYAVAYTALKSFNTKNEILECLGKRRAQLAVDLGPVLWRGVPDEVHIRQADVDNLPDEPVDIANQPAFNLIRGKMDRLMVRMGQYAKNTPPLPDAVKDLPTLVDKDVVVSNLTQSSLLQGGLASGFPAFLNGLMAKGFYHFGCFAQNTDATGKYANNTNVLFLAFKAQPTENKTTVDNTLAMFPVFTGGLISALVVSDNIDWIRGVLAHRDQAFDCNGFQVDDKQPGPVSQASLRRPS